MATAAQITFYNMNGQIYRKAEGTGQVTSAAAELASAMPSSSELRPGLGNLCVPMRNFLGGLRVKGAPGRPRQRFPSTGTQHGGLETTMVSVH